MLFYLGLCHNVSISAGDVFKMTPGLYLYIDAMCIIFLFFFVCVEFDSRLQLGWHETPRSTLREGRHTCHAHTLGAFRVLWQCQEFANARLAHQLFFSFCLLRFEYNSGKQFWPFEWHQFKYSHRSNFRGNCVSVLDQNEAYTPTRREDKFTALILTGHSLVAVMAAKKTGHRIGHVIRMSIDTKSGTGQDQVQTCLQPTTAPCYKPLKTSQPNWYLLPSTCKKKKKTRHTHTHTHCRAGLLINLSDLLESFGHDHFFK